LAISPDVPSRRSGVHLTAFGAGGFGIGLLARKSVEHRRVDETGADAIGAILLAGAIERHASREHD
jgi:hypothetical protein